MISNGWGQLIVENHRGEENSENKVYKRELHSGDLARMKARQEAIEKIVRLVENEGELSIRQVEEKMGKRKGGLASYMEKELRTLLKIRMEKRMYYLAPLDL
jgi:hypothetical protein